MKTYGKNFMLLMAVVLASVTSCVNDQLSEPLDDQILKELPVLEEQLAAVEASAKDMKALNEALQSFDMEISGAVKALDSHVAALKGGMSLEEGTLATLDLQKQIAGIVGEAEASLLASGDMDNTMMRHILALEGSVKMWLGEPFSFYYPVALAQSKVNAVVAGFDAKIKKQKLYVDALTSDVEAGLRKDEKPEELTALTASVNRNVEEAKELSTDIAAMAAEMEEGYRTALKTAVTDPANFDSAALKALNSGVEVQSVDNTLAGMIARVADCETRLVDVLDRLGALEETVGSLEELLGLIQSVSLMTEYSADEVVAKYNLVTTEWTSEGYMKRQPESSISMNYVVRPASAASALTSSDMWNQGLKVIGYYAGRIEQAAASQNLVDFNITGVTADALTGVVTVTIDNNLSEDFYYKRTGAKMALSLATGKTDLTSKFAEVVPMDASGTVYVEALSLSTDYVEVDCDLTHQLRATLTPEEPTEATLIWTSSDDNIATVSGTGVVTAKAVGEANITVTTKSTNEWGQTLSKVCRVKVMPNIKLEAANYVEVGGTMTINVKSPNYIDKQYIKWSSSNTYYATVDEDGVVTGAVSTYNTTDNVYDNITITCTIGDYMPTVLTHTMPVVVAQPKGVRFNSLADGVEQTTIKIAEEFSLAGTIIPEAAASNFRLFYQAAGGGNEAVASINHQTGAVTAKSPGAVTFMARVLENDQKYYYPRGTEVWRWVTVNVEPYYVNTISLPETLEMAPETSATLSPEFTSDVDGVQPTYKTVTWTSSDPSKVSVNAETGELTAIAEGTVYITATTNNTWAVPEGQSQKSATCIVTVKAPTVAINVGDYYYSDGTWSTERDYSKTVIGVIFSTANAVASDPLLLRDYPDCSHGLVVSTVEYADQDFGSVANYNGHSYYVGIGYDATAIVNTEKPNGYGNTLAHRDLNASKSGYCTFFNSTDGVVKTHTNAVATPSSASAWYIPSYKEMQLINENRSVINASISAVGGTSVAEPYAGEDSSDDNRSSDWYWTSTIKGSWYANGQTYDHYKYPFDISKNDWTTAVQAFGICKVRVVLAF